MLLVYRMIISRRALMLGTGAAALQQGFAIGRSFADAGIKETRLTAKPAIVKLTGGGYPDTAV
jgi:hypothetical protein